MSRKLLLWASLVAATFLLSLDFWRWQRDIELTILGLPDWIFYFFFLQIVFIVLLGVFVRYLWGKQKEE